MGEGGSSDITIDMGSLESSLQQKIEAKDPFMSPNCCIFKTPKILLRHNAKAFLPNAFSIGPIHHGKEDLKATEKIKHKYMQSLVHRSMLPVSRFIEVIKKIEEEARDYYAQPIVLSKEDFVEMLVLDGCFIIELFLRNNSEELRDADDPIFTMSCLRQCLDHDLVLLENQIPWKVLEHLFDLNGLPTSIPLDSLAIIFFFGILSYQAPLSFDSLTCTYFAKHRHILELLRNWLVLSSKEEGSNQTSGSGQENNNQTAGPGGEGSNRSSISEGVGGGWQRFPSATNLNEAGVKFIKVTADSILDINFTNGTLKIPSLIIHEHTETILRNLISFEQCTPNCSPRITSYVILMDNLINTTKDLEILCKKKIIDNWLDPNDATQTFNNLYDDVCVEKYYYANLCNRVNEHCERRLPRWRAYIVHNYWTPWGIVGLFVGGSVWILTLLQTIYTVKL